MDGAFYVEGNSNATAEFNWWFDAEAIKYVVVPLDATDKILFKKKYCEKWIIGKFHDHFMSKYFLVPKFQKKFKKNPDYSIPVWDALVPAYLYDPNVVKEKRRLYTSVDSTHDPSYGSAIFSIPGMINLGAKHPGES